MNRLSANRTVLGLNRATQGKILWAAIGVFLLYDRNWGQAFIPSGLTPVSGSLFKHIRKPLYVEWRKVSRSRKDMG